MAKKDMVLVTDVVKNKEGIDELVTKTYPYPIFVKGSITKQAIDLGAKLEGAESDISSDIVDDMADFVVNVYGDQFDRDELIDGLQAHEVMNKLGDVLSFVMSGEEQENESRKFIQAKTS